MLFAALVLSRAFTLRSLMQRGKLGPLVCCQRPSHPEQHHGPALVQLRTGNLDAADLLHHGAIVALLDQPFEFRLGLVECLLLDAQVWSRCLKDILETTALFGSQSQLP